MDKTVRYGPVTVKQRIMVFLAGVVSVGALFTLASCGIGGKVSEPFRDAPRGATNSAPADVIEMPDGFSNLATKCDHGNRIYVVFKGDDLYGSVTVVGQDPSCK